MVVVFFACFPPLIVFFFLHSCLVNSRLLCPITLWSAADHQDCHCLSVFSATDPPPTVLSKSCCSWKHNTVGFLSQVVSGRPLALISWLSLACRCGRQTPHFQQSLEFYLLQTWQTCSFCSSCVISHPQHFHHTECWGRLLEIKPLPSCWISWKLQLTGGCEQQKLKRLFSFSGTIKVTMHLPLQRKKKFLLHLCE